MNPSYYDDLRVYILFSLILSVILVTGLIVYLALKNLWTRPNSQGRFKGREPLTLDEFYLRFYADEGFSRNVVEEVLVSFAEAGRLPHALLRPEDSFNGLHVPESEPTAQFSRDAATLIDAREQQFGVRLFEGPLTTLDDYIRVYCLAQRLESRRGSAGS